jgi:hypothetical protein
MGLLDKAKRRLKGSKEKASSPSGSVPAAEATTSKDPQQSIDAEIRPVEARRLLGANVWSPGVSPIVEYAVVVKIGTLEIELMCVF